MPSDNEICQMEAVELAGRVRAKEFSPVEVVEAMLDQSGPLLGRPAGVTSIAAFEAARPWKVRWPPLLDELGL